MFSERKEERQGKFRNSSVTVTHCCSLGIILFIANKRNGTLESLYQPLSREQSIESLLAR